MGGVFTFIFPAQYHPLNRHWKGFFLLAYKIYARKTQCQLKRFQFPQIHNLSAS